jgi:hypothetical protein
MTAPPPFGIACFKCGVAVGDCCKTATGWPAPPHVARWRASGIDRPTDAHRDAALQYVLGRAAAKRSVMMEDAHRQMRERIAAPPVEPSAPISLQEEAFLARFVRRGWLAADREDKDEQAICRRAHLAGYLRRVRGEYQFTDKGEAALLGD